MSYNIKHFNFILTIITMTESEDELLVRRISSMNLMRERDDQLFPVIRLKDHF